MRVDGALEAMAVAAVFLCCRALHTHWAGAVRAGSFANGVGLSERALNSLVLSLKMSVSSCLHTVRKGLYIQARR